MLLKLISMFLAFISMSWIPIGKYLADNLRSDWYVRQLDPIDYSDLPSDVRDTLRYVSTRYKYAIHSGKPDVDISLIDFTHEYQSETVGSGPWMVREDYRNIKTGRCFHMDYSIPKPVIIHGNDIYAPIEYNVIPFDSVPETQFYHFKLRYR